MEARPTDAAGSHTGTGAAAAVAGLQLRPDALLLPVRDAVYVFTPRGRTDLRGRGIDRVHAQLAPLLCGRHSFEALVRAASAPAAPAVDAYLNGLWSAAALRLASAVPRVVDVHVVGARGAARRLFAAGRRADAESPAVHLVVEDGLADAAPRHRAHLDWLGHVAARNGGDPTGFRLFQLRGDGLLTQLVAVSADGSDAGTIPEQIGLIRPVEADQLPLVDCTASHRYFRGTLRAVGIGFDAVRDALVRRFVARQALYLEGSSIRWRTVTLTAGALGCGGETRAWTRARGPMVAGSLTELLLSLQEHAAAPPPAGPLWHPCDLNREVVGRPELEALLDARSRAPRRVRTVYTATVEGMHWFRDGPTVTRSRLRVHGLAQLLIRQLQRTDAAPEERSRAVVATRHADFATGPELRRLWRATPGEGESPGRRTLAAVARVRRWGTVVWMGRMLSAGPERRR